MKLVFDVADEGRFRLRPFRFSRRCLRLAAVLLLACVGPSGSAATVNYSVVTTNQSLTVGPDTWTGVFTVSDLSASVTDAANISNLTAVSGTHTYTMSPVDFAGITPPDSESQIAGVAYWGMLTEGGNNGLNVFSTDLYNLLATAPGTSWNDLVAAGTFNLSAGAQDFTQVYVDTVEMLAGRGGTITFSPGIVPEPSTCAMAIAGLACGGYSMFRRRKRA